MPNNLDEFVTVIGAAVNLKRPDADDKTNFAVKSFVTGKYINCTLWDNSHGHINLNQGDAVVINGPLKKTPKKDGDGFWLNVNVKSIGLIPMDNGTDTRQPAASSAGSDDEPDVL